ncbi:MAG: bile acid:sodium symporter family protein [Pirellulaceae bacterium]
MKVVLEKFLLLWLVVSSGIAFVWPALAATLPESWRMLLGDPFVAGKPYLPPLMSVTMFAIGALLPHDELRQVIRRWPAVAGGTLLQYTSMPLLAYLTSRLFGLSGPDYIGVVLVGCVPGAMASNVLTMNARGNTSYSVSLTTASTLLSPLAVPLLMGLALASEKDVSLDFLKTSRSLLLTVVGPVLLGHILSRRFAWMERVARHAGATVANLTILYIIAVVVGLTRAELAGSSAYVVWVLLVVNVLGYLAGYLGGRVMQLPDTMRRALTLEIGMQNAGLGATLATQLFPDQHAIAMAPALYTFGCMLTGTMLAHLWSRRQTHDSASAPAAAVLPSRPVCESLEVPL